MDETRRIEDAVLRGRPAAPKAERGLDAEEGGAPSVGERSGVVVESAEGAGIFVVSAPLGPLPENPAAAAELLVKAMASNLCLAATGGGSLGLDARSGMLVLSYIEESGGNDRARLAEVVALCRRKTAELRGSLMAGRDPQTWISF
ncbi:type III secretion system chaperone [Pelagibius sp.]|uniref:type III secretion system chaperone n=1 Tax=Pelagibius sp. TaxID=1931238 RepID=UPI003B510D13